MVGRKNQKRLNMKNLFKESKKRNLNHWKFFTVAMGLLLISMLALAQRYERAIFVFILGIVTFVAILRKERKTP